MYLDGLQAFVNQIDTITYHDFTIDKSYFKGELIFNRGNEMRITCSALYERQHKQMRQICIPLCKKSPNIY